MKHAVSHILSFAFYFINETDIEFCLLFSLERPLTFYFVYVCLAITFTGINNNIKKKNQSRKIRYYVHSSSSLYGYFNSVCFC